MSLDSAPITVRVPYLVELGRGMAQTVTAPLYRDGALVTATAATATLLDAAGQTVASGGAVVGGVATWTVTVATSAQLGAAHRIHWSITHAGGVIAATQSASVVRRPLYPVVTDADLYRRQPTLNPTLDETWAPNGVVDWQDYIDEAWTEVHGRVVAQGQRPALIMSPDALRSVHLYLTLALIYEGPMRQRDEQMVDYRTLYEAAWSALAWVYDADDDGIPDEAGARQAGSPTLWLC